MSYDIQAMSREKENMKLMAARMINENLSMLKYEKEQYVNYEMEIIPSYRKNMEAILVAYRQNTGNFFVLFDAKFGELSDGHHLTQESLSELV